MHAAVTIASRILRQRIRDRSAVIYAVITPLALAAAFGLLVPGATAFHTSYVIYDADRGSESKVLVEQVLGSLVKAGVIDVKLTDTAAAARAEVDANNASVGILIPAGFSDAIHAGQPVTVQLVAGDAPTALQIARSALGRYAGLIGRARLAVETTIATGGTTFDTNEVAQAALNTDPIASRDATTGRRQADMKTFYAAAMAIMFLFFATQYGAISLMGERRTGTLSRLLAAPIRPSSIIFGAAIASFLLGLLAMTVMVLATTLLFGASWGSPPLVALLVLAAVTAGTGVSTLVCMLGRTEEQAGSLNTVVAIVLAVLGGTFIPLAQGPELLARISLVTPHAWFLRAIDTMAAPAASLGDVLPSVAVLTVVGLVTVAIGLVRSQKVLVAR
jgi:ABC-2 type transport system permease protein